MNRVHSERRPSKLFLMWLPVLIILLIKSNIVLASLFSMNTAIFIIVFIDSIYKAMPLIFLISFSLLLSVRGQLFYLFCLDLFISLLFIADMVYGRAYGHLISVYMMFAKDVMKDLDASIISLVNWSDFLMLIDLPFLFILAVKTKNIERVRKRTVQFIITAVLSLLIICLEFTQLEESKAISNYRLHPFLMTPAGNHMFDLFRFVYEKTDTLDSKDIAEIEFWLAKNAKYQEPDKKYVQLKGLIKGKNIIAIQFESLENILIGQSYFGQEITPNINRLLKSSIYFNHIQEQVKDGNSSDAELLTMTSTYPISRGSTFIRFGENNYVSLPKLLKEKGYASIAIHGDDKEFWNRDNVFPALGIERYITEEEFDDKTSSGMGILDKSLFSQSISEIKKLKEPYNFLIITITSHMPFELKKDLQYLNLPKEDVTSNYLQSIHYTDKAFGEFYNNLEAEGLLDNTVLIIYGDHEGVHKYYETTLPDNNHEIPFIIHIPGMEGFKVNKIGGQVDMMPTLSYLLGIDAKKYSSAVMGRNLFGSDKGAAVLPTGEILGETNDKEHLTSAQSIADLIIRGNYFNVKKGK